MDDYDSTLRKRKIENLLRYIGRQIKSAMPEGYGFALQIFRHDELFYISSAQTAQKDDMINAIQEFLDRERKPSGD